LLRLSVPGNLLLLGEYAVVEPGGLGIAIAIEPRVTAVVRPAESATVAGFARAGGDTVESRWPGGTAGLLGFAAGAVAAALARRAGGPGLAPVDVRVDSTGLAKGCGSSAAAAVAACAALLAAGGLRDAALVDEAAAAALAAHRAFQGGRGSGYDVTASARGGIGLFCGGERPQWTPLALEWIGPLVLFPGPAAVATSGSVARYQEWKKAHPAEAAAFLSASNEAVAAFAGSSGWDEAARWFGKARELALALGRAIGVSADLAPPAAAAPGVLCKAVGAGNELGVLVGPGAAGAAASEAVARIAVCAAGLVVEAGA
jgi:phosphomevalonate kinase